MKKIISMLLALTLVLTGTKMVFAAETEEYKAVLQLVKDRFEIKDVYDDFSSDTYTENDKTQYRFEWSTDEGDSLSVICGADGIVKSYYDYPSDYDYSTDRTFNPYTWEEYRDEAQKLVNKINPGLSDNLRVELPTHDDGWGEEIYMNVTYLKNGIRVTDLGGSIVLNSKTLRLRSFNLYEYYSLVYPEGPFIDKETALDKFYDSYGMELWYRISYDEKDNRKVSAIYSPKRNYNEFINAVTGEPYRYDYEIRYTKEAAAGKNIALMDIEYRSDFSEIEQKEIDAVSGLMDKDKLVSMLYQNRALNLTSSDKLTSSRLSKNDYNDKYTYWFSFTSNKDVYVSCTVDAEDGTIYSYYRSGQKPGKNKISKEKADAKAEEYVKLLAGSRLNEYKKEESTRDYSYYYQRYVNEAGVEGDSLNVTLNPYDGTLASYNMSYTDGVEFPSLSGCITKEEAFKKASSGIEYAVRYMPVYNEEGTAKEAVAVYSFDETRDMSVDAFTGEYLYDDSYYSNKITYDDIEGHYAQAAIEALADYGIGFERKNFEPDSPIKQKDYEYLLSCVYENRWVKPYSLGYIKDEERNEEGTVSRKQAADFLIRAMNLSAAAELDGIWKSPFGDVTEKPGSVCILYGMGIIKGDENALFHPDDVLTNATAALILYSALNR